jgi:hypothetical protein
MMENFRTRNVIVEDTDQINGLLNELDWSEPPAGNTRFPFTKN